MDLTIKTHEGYLNMRVAAVITYKDKLLVMENKDYDSFYLPGGRVRFNESFDEAVRREISEELHIEISSYRPLWIHECFFIEDSLNERFHEICMYYFVDITDAGFASFDDRFVLTEENRLNYFRWIPFDKLSEQTVYPLFIKDEIYSLPTTLIYRTDREV